MSSNRLRLNCHQDASSIWFGTRQQLAKRDLTSLASISPPLVSNDPVRNLGVLLDSELTMDAHHQTTVPSHVSTQLRRLRVVRNCLSKSIFADSYICFRSQQAEDYCNSILFGVTAGRLDRLQSEFSHRRSATGPQPSEVLANHVGHPTMSCTGSLLRFDPNTNFHIRCAELS